MIVTDGRGSHRSGVIPPKTLARIRRALLDHGIPARLSSTAGTYLCNAAMYRFLRAVPASVPCGFIHIPLLRAQVAQLLDLSVKTVETHRSQIMARLDIHDVAGLVRFAIRNGLVTP